MLISDSYSLEGAWTAPKLFSAYFSIPNATTGRQLETPIYQLSSGSHLVYQQGTETIEISIPASGYREFIVDVNAGLSSSYVVPKEIFANNTINRPRSGENLYTFQTSAEGELYKAGCMGGTWGENSISITLRLYSNRTLKTYNGVDGYHYELSLNKTLPINTYASVTCAFIACKLKEVKSDNTTAYIFDGIAALDRGRVISGESPTYEHDWNDYNISNCPSIVYYGKSNEVSESIPIRYEMIATDNPNLIITYLVPFLRTYFSEKYGDEFLLSRVDAYRHSTKLSLDFILSLNYISGYASFLMTISDFINGLGTNGSAIFLVYPGPGISYFFWDNNDGSLDNQIISGGAPIEVGLSASNWARLQAKINEVQSAFSVTPTSFTLITSGDIILASHYNELVNALGTLPVAAVPILPPSVASGDVIHAYLFNGNVSDDKLSVKFVLNVAILYYNNNR